MSTTAELLAAWLNGAPTGGPNHDGRYPLVYQDGNTYLVYCPAAQALNPALVEQPIETFSVNASNAAANALAEANEATSSALQARNSATAAATSATTANNKAIAANIAAAAADAQANAAADSATAAATSATSAAASATSANTSATNAATSESHAATSASNAATSETNAAASAAAAATVNPSNYYLKTDSDARYRLQSVSITYAELSGKPTTFAGLGLPILVADVPALPWSKITSGTPTTLAGYGITDAIPSSQKGAANGVTPLGSDNKIATTYLPTAVLGQVSYQGTWDASTAAPSSTPTKGQYWVVTVAGSTSLSGITDWKVGDWAIHNGTTWDKVDNTDAISSWNGRTGAIVPAANDYTFAQIGSKPTTLSGYGITDTLVQAGTGTGQLANLVKIGWSGTRLKATVDSTDLGNFVFDSQLTWANLGSKPTTIAGFGLTDAAPINAPVFTNQVNTNGVVRSTGISGVTATGAGVEMFWHTTNLEGTIHAYDRTAAAYKPMNVNGSVITVQASGVDQMVFNGTTVTRKNANSTTMTAQPRVFVQSADPGAAAADGDLWVW